MKNKIIAFAVSTALLLASLSLFAFATGAPLSVSSGVFTLETTAENLEFTMADAGLAEVTTNYFDTAFDSNGCDASYYGAYRASLSDADGLALPFTSEMKVRISLGEEYAEKEIFVFYITDALTASEKVDAVSNAASITISGEDFAAMSNNIIVVMTSTKSAPAEPASPIVPAVICASVALVAIVASVMVVKNKNGKNSIVD